MIRKKWNVTEDGERLDKAISLLDNELSRMAIQRLIEEGKVFVNGKVQKASYKLKNGDEIVLENEEPKETTLVAEDIPLDIIYEDSDILVINKPKGLVVHPRQWKSRWHTCKCCTCILQRQFIRNWW